MMINRKILPILGPFSSETEIYERIESGNFYDIGRNAVIALAKGYNIKQLKPFVQSLRCYNKECDIIIFYSNLSSATKKYLLDNQCTLIEFNQTMYGQHISIHNSRHFAILSWLLNELSNQSLPKNILLTDIRDVIFQDDPFKDSINSIEFFLESSPPTIGNCAANSVWIRRCFGDQELHKLYDKKISCSGTIFANGIFALRYLLLMQNYLLKLPKNIQSTICDQGIHNYILYNNLLDKIKLFENGNKVLTLSYVDNSLINIYDDKIFLQKSKHKISIIHQWDRVKSSKDFVLEFFDIKPNILTERYTLIRNKIRKNFSINKIRRFLFKS